MIPSTRTIWLKERVTIISQPRVQDEERWMEPQKNRFLENAILQLFNILDPIFKIKIKMLYGLF